MVSKFVASQTKQSIDDHRKSKPSRWMRIQLVMRQPSVKNEWLSWRVLWIPYWIGSDLPTPQLPRRNRPIVVAGPAGQSLARSFDRMTRRFWLQRILIILGRVCSLILLVSCCWLFIELMGGPVVEKRQLIAIAVALLIAGFVFASFVQPTWIQIARALDRSFHLQERMTTAIENISTAAPPDDQFRRVNYLQIADAANIAAELQYDPALKLRLPMREIAMMIGFALFFALLVLLRGVSGGLPVMQSARVPVFIPAEQRLALQPTMVAEQTDLSAVPTIEEVQLQSQLSNDAKSALNILSQALNDHAVTHGAASAIQRGDYDAAANELRQAATTADQLSDAERQGLAEDLERAATRIENTNSDLAASVRQAAEGLRQGGNAARTALQQLGDAVEQAGKTIIPQQELAQRMQQAQLAQANSRSASSQQQTSGQSQSGENESSSSDSSGENDQNQLTDTIGQGVAARPGLADTAGSDGDAQTAQDAQSIPAQESGDGTDPTKNQSATENENGVSPNMQTDGGSTSAQQRAAENQTDGDSGQQGIGATSGSANSNSTDDNSGDEQVNARQGGKAGTGESSDPQQLPEQNNADSGDQSENQDNRNHDTIQLPQNAANNQSVRTSDSGSASSYGSGTGVRVGGGTAIQAQIGEAGPDSNRVPPAYRQLVEDYFSNPNGN